MLLTSRCMGLKQVILAGGKQSASMKARHGLTPPMRDAARRMFDRTPAVDQKTMQKLEDDLLLIAQVQLLLALHQRDIVHKMRLSACSGARSLPHQCNGRVPALWIPAMSIMPGMLSQC